MDVQEIRKTERDVSSDTSFWEKLYAESGNFEEPILHKDFFAKPLLTEEEVRSIFISWAKQPFYKAVLGIDMTVKGVKRDSYDQLLYKLPFHSDSTIEELYNKLIGNKQASILIKSAEQYFDPLATRVANFLEPLIKKYELPQFRWTTALIIGNYGYTPFGVHFDAGNQRAIHTMVGKGKKKMWYWKRDLVDKIVSSQGLNSLRYYSENEVHKLTPHGECHTIRENDFYFLPNQHYHIAHVDEFTIGLAIAIDRVDQGSIVSRAHSTYMSSNLADCLETSSPFFEPDKIDYLDLKEAEEKMSNKWLTNAVKREILKSKSNLGMAVSPQELPLDDHDISNSKVIINDPFKIMWEISGGELCLFVRNRVIPLSYNESDEKSMTLVSILEKLNEGEELEFLFISEYMKEEMVAEDVEYLFKILYSYGGVKFI